MRLDLFSRNKLHAALKKAGYPDLPAPRTLGDWITKDSGPESLRLFLSEMLGTQKEAASSLVTRRLLAGVIALEKKAEISPDELASAEESAEMIEAAMAVDARLAAELEASRRRSSERALGPTGGPTGESLGSKRQKR